MSTNALSHGTIEESLKGSMLADSAEQYSLCQILGIWASVALPMALIFWVIIPGLGPRLDVNPGLLFYILIILGMVWQGIVAYIVLRWEVKPFTWEGVRDRLWLHTPSHPGTGVRSKWLYLWLVPFVMLSQANGIFTPFGWLNDLWVKTVPFLASRPYAVIDNMAEVAEGQWWLLCLLAVAIVFNYLLGEELIFRGILLPKMNGVFGKWDWLANHLLFSSYHLHYLWTTPSRLLVNWIYAWPTKQFKSYWMGVVIHGSDAVFLAYMFILAIKGLV